MSMTDVQTQITNALTATSQFSTNRIAMFFKPGQYSLDVHVSYYEQVLGLGQSPDDVSITGFVRSTGTNGGDALSNFWRSAENLSVTPMGSPDMWAVSQGCSFRRMHVKGALVLADTGSSSGGFLADSKVDSQVTSASQQQWFSRNAQWATWSGGVWNMVFSGVSSAPTGTWPVAPDTVIASTPVIAEKPYLTIDGGGQYSVVVPPLKTMSSGISWAAGTPPSGTTVPIGSFYLAHAGTDTAETINAALESGENLILTPGIYHLDSSIAVSRAGTIVLGLGMATLVPDDGTPAMTVADVDGVKIAGLLFDAGATSSPTLLQVGTQGSAQDHAQNPTGLYDVFCRVGGATAGTAASCVTINSSDVIGDNLWLWRADHGTGVGWTQNAAVNGLVVNGNGVTMYGLAVEHFEGYQTLWNGNGGQLYFYQSEMPYDPPAQASWQSPGGGNGFASYKVADAVTSHTAMGLGVYCAFKQSVVADNAAEAPTATGVSVHHVIDVWLNGAAGSAISHVLSGTGNGVSQTNKISTVN